MQIELRDVCKSFGKHPVLRGIDLQVPHGARVGLVGPNGSGKSTLLRILMGLLRPEGTVLVGGIVPFAEREKIATQLAYVPQVAPQLGASLGEVVAAVVRLRQIDRARVEEGARRLGLNVAEEQRKPFRVLSGGMKQKALIALALASNPALVILDEPTASLDRAARGCFWEMLDEAAASATVLLCSHRSEEVSGFVEREIELLEGRLVGDVTSDRDMPRSMLRTLDPARRETL